MHSPLKIVCRALYSRKSAPILATANRHLTDGSSKNTNSKLHQLLQSIPREKINERDGRGWTALMLAAKEGDVAAVDVLLEKGSQTDLCTPSGHTAYNIATFWRREACAKHLKPAFLPDNSRIFFTFDGVQRNSNKRDNSEWIKDCITKDSSQFILLHQAKPMVTYDGAISLKAKQAVPPKLMYKSYPDVHHLVHDDLHNLVYLGAYAREDGIDRRPGTKHVDQNIFAIDVSDNEESLVKQIYKGCEVLPPFPGLLRLSFEDAGIVAQARSILDWQHRYKYCPSCGSPTEIQHSGYRSKCSNTACSSHRGESNTNHPRVDPTVICAVMSRDNEQCLLGRQKSFPHGLYSCLAGFLEPGESIEQACRREVLEEVGIHISRVTYQSSQPWPIPCSLMLGCTSYADHSRNIEMDTGELEDARWFTREEIVMMLMQLHPEGLFLPPIQAIAHGLINDWMIKTAFD